VWTRESQDVAEDSLGLTTESSAINRQYHSEQLLHHQINLQKSTENDADENKVWVDL
jgi:hypothetical protein